MERNNRGKKQQKNNITKQLEKREKEATAKTQELTTKQNKQT